MCWVPAARPAPHRPSTWRGRRDWHVVCWCQAKGSVCPEQLQNDASRHPLRRPPCHSKAWGGWFTIDRRLLPKPPAKNLAERRRRGPRVIQGTIGRWQGVGMWGWCQRDRALGACRLLVLIHSRPRAGTDPRKVALIDATGDPVSGSFVVPPHASGKQMSELPVRQICKSTVTQLVSVSFPLLCTGRHLDDLPLPGCHLLDFTEKPTLPSERVSSTQKSEINQKVVHC